MSKKFTVTIDGVNVPAKEDQTIMQVADAAGIYIPRLCWHKDLFPGGNCRVCTVRMNGRPVSACTYPVAENQLIENDTKELMELRRRLVELHFIEGNHCCPSCELSGNCELQATGYRVGMIAPTLPYLYPENTVDATHKEVYIDRDRCILCGRCIRASRDLDKKNVFGLVGRGIHTKITVNSDSTLCGTNMKASDKAACICPTGALVVKGKGFSIPVGKRKYDFEPIGSDVEKKRKSG